MRRDSSRERLFFLLVLAGTLLLLSALMLRHESAALPTRTFRDGFTVAEDVVRRTEITEDGDEITIKRAATSKGNKITTISRDEKGKLTIEDTTAEEERQVEAENVSNQTQEGKKQDTQLEGIPAESPSAIYKEDTSTTEAVMVDSGKKVTIMQVNRSLAKVSLSGVEENADEKATR
ncbi:uncharacterized protein PITG_12662 [Phytophthora infestans T30-4]|uniref:Uncharacterized protein n=1 Tax=Phytophthora infestans (strain T30-4) TaxID=403677 RepID=D0NKW6_PHYIT|nr:uncharacterized protein PITG_12662 [Phytophthora infestans T30-4]EEY60284.1 conserved hypothetical protein [Phytophthora infestans T30-4]|eukprot:XP_002900080.1 conserved hypothetical protein [Phytophthora infestans T30-4]